MHKNDKFKRDNYCIFIVYIPVIPLKLINENAHHTGTVTT